VTSVFARIAALVALAALLPGLAGCNTIEGVGRDLRVGGQALEKAAKSR
jgi:predicted small secreted protein